MAASSPSTEGHGAVAEKTARAAASSRLGACATCPTRSGVAGAAAVVAEGAGETEDSGVNQRRSVGVRQGDSLTVGPLILARVGCLRCGAGGRLGEEIPGSTPWRRLRRGLAVRLRTPRGGETVGTARSEP